MEELMEEKKRKRKAMFLTGAIQVALLFILYFLVAWREPNPPNPEFGIELNFGTSATGKGDTPVQSPVPSQETESEEPSSAKSETTSEETQDAPTDVKPVEPVKNPNPDVVQEKTEASKPKATSTNTTKNTETKPNTSQQGDKPNTSQGVTGTKGDQGDPKGDLNKNAQYTGVPGGGDNGSSLDLAGWQWDDPPKPKDTSDEAGKIVYEITVDENGYPLIIKLITSTVSPLVEKKYAAAVSQLTFSKTSSYKPAPSSKGTITFIIRSR